MTGRLACTIALSLTVMNAHAASKMVLDTPRGGEYFVVGSMQTVRLGGKIKASSVNVEISWDGGTSFSPLGTATVTKGVAQELAFMVAPPVSASCMVRATATIKGKATTITSRPFTIAPLPLMSFTDASIDSAIATNGFALTADRAGGARSR